MNAEEKNRKINDALQGVSPSKNQIMESLDSVIACKEAEILLEGDLYKGNPYKKGDARYELLALYKARELLNQ